MTTYEWGIRTTLKQTITTTSETHYKTTFETDYINVTTLPLTCTWGGSPSLDSRLIVSSELMVVRGFTYVSSSCKKKEKKNPQLMTVALCIKNYDLFVQFI